MASTITPASLNVTIREQITMNGTDYGSLTRYAAHNITEVSRRIIATNGTGSTTIIRFQPSASAGQFINTDVRYVRITNLDNANYATLRFRGAAATDYAFRLDPTGSHLLMSTQASGSSNSGVTSYADISGITLTDLRTISATANSASVNLELFVASV
jgi:hypothetical protein|tara:strand:+ start:535 stop:1008 length:474 start_codon:yes stop_codon:yes gene_type:complete